MSDHRPVAADFNVVVRESVCIKRRLWSSRPCHLLALQQIDALNQEDYVESLKRYHREVDRLDSAQERKGLQIDNAYIDFGTLRYVQRRRQGAVDCFIR